MFFVYMHFFFVFLQSFRAMHSPNGEVSSDFQSRIQIKNHYNERFIQMA